MSQTTDLAAILAAINGQFSTGTYAYELGDPALPALSTPHIVVMVYRRYVPERLGSGEVPLPGGRVVTRYVAKKGADVRNLRAKTTAGIEDKILPGDVGPFTFETSSDDGTDETWLVESDSWTY